MDISTATNPIWVTAIIALASALVGGWIAHRFELGRDRRREYNEVIKQFRQFLFAEIENPSPWSNPFSEPILDPLFAVYPWRCRNRLKKAIENYKNTAENTPYESAAGAANYVNPAPVSKALREILNLLEYR